MLDYVDNLYFEIIYKTKHNPQGLKFECSRENLNSTIQLLKEYNEGFELMTVTPWRISKC